MVVKESTWQKEKHALEQNLEAALSPNSSTDPNPTADRKATEAKNRKDMAQMIHSQKDLSRILSNPIAQIYLQEYYLY